MLKVGKAKKTLEERFWEKVDKKDENECWEWKGAITSRGYGSILNGSKLESAHRVAYILRNGKIPDEMLVLHSCDNRKCCNVNHLFLGTYQDNMDDMVSKERSYKPIGEKHPNTDLTWDIINEIREKYSKGWTVKKLSEEYNINISVLYSIIENINWKDVNYKYINNGKGFIGRITNAKKTRKEVNEIREKYKNGISISNLAKESELTWQNIKYIVTNKSWYDLEYQKWINNKMGGCD
jgi:hypothetical protein